MTETPHSGFPSVNGEYSANAGIVHAQTAHDAAPMLVVKELVRDFGAGSARVRAVDGVDFVVGRGEIVAVVGESGSGKSTLGRMILRLLPPTSGTIHLDGKDVTALKSTNELKGYWRMVQAVFQDPFAAFNQFYSNEDLLENALKVLTPRPSAQERKDRIAASLREVGLTPESVLKKGPHQLSGGQVQRVMIARALVVGPELLVADEPTSMLDASLRVTVLNLVKDLRVQHAMSILFITHDLGQAYYIADRILVMYQGKIVEQGPVEEVLLNPQHEYTRRLMSDVPLLHGRGSFLEEYGGEPISIEGGFYE